MEYCVGLIKAINQSLKKFGLAEVWTRVSQMTGTLPTTPQAHASFKNLSFMELTIIFDNILSVDTRIIFLKFV
jgi:hypothetical protein